MKTWKFELNNNYIIVKYYEAFNEYSVSVRTKSGYEAEFKTYKNKGAVNRYLKSWGLDERI